MDEALRKCQGRHELGASRPLRRWDGVPEREEALDNGRAEDPLHLRNEGADAVAAILGRSPKAVRRMASKAHVSLRVRPGDVCPVCGMREVRPHTGGKARHVPDVLDGEAHPGAEEEACQKRAEREFQAAKKRAQRA